MAMGFCDSAQARSTACSELKRFGSVLRGREAKEGLQLVGVGLLKANTLMNQQWHLINV